MVLGCCWNKETSFLTHLLVNITAKRPCICHRSNQHEKFLWKQEYIYTLVLMKQNNVSWNFWRQLCEKYSHTRLVWPALHHILREYGTYSANLHIQSKCGKNIAPEKGSEHGYYKLQYKPPNNENENRSKSTKNHKRNIIWFNRPFSKNVSNNIGKYFFLFKNIFQTTLNIINYSTKIMWKWNGTWQALNQLSIYTKK